MAGIRDNTVERRPQPGARLGTTTPRRAAGRPFGLTLAAAVAAAALLTLPTTPIAAGTSAGPEPVVDDVGATLPAQHAIGPDGFLRRGFCANELSGEFFLRTELFFGLSRPGGTVSEEDFQAFLDREVTPRFPAGLTLLSGNGQFRDEQGVIIEEGSKLLILLYHFNRKNNQAIEDIRRAYLDQFQQESVLRIDGRSCVSF